jgi:hypothetical protein
VVCGVVKLKTTTRKLVSRDREENISVTNEFVNNRWNFSSRMRQAGIRVEKKEDRCVKTRRVDSTKWFTARNISQVLTVECKVYRMIIILYIFSDIIGILKMAVISFFLQAVVYKNPKFHAISMKISTI